MQTTNYPQHSTTQINGRVRTGAESPLVTAALALAASGLPVFPCNAEKKPIVESGFKSASRDPAIITEMFMQPGAILIGVPTGRASKLVAIDVDPRHGGDTWLHKHQHHMPRTLTHSTPSGGLHFIFRDPDRVEIRNSQGRIADGVDVRGTGGYLIMPPSPGYGVKHNGVLATMPQWLVTACLKPEPPPPPPRSYRPPLAGDGTPYGLKALREECIAIQTASFGKQEKTLNDAALKMGGLVAAGELAEGYALSELIAAGNGMASEKGREPWRQTEIEKKVRRAFADGMRTPRAVPPPKTARDQGQHNEAGAAEPPPENAKPRDPVDGSSKQKEQKPEPIPQRDKIVKAVLDAKVTFWRDADGEAYATVPCEKRIERYRVRSTAFRNIVRGIYGDAFPSKFGKPGAVSDTAWREARPQFEAIAFRGLVRSPEVRLHRDDAGAVWIDLGDPTWRLARVDGNGWRIEAKADVPLVRSDGLRAMFEPRRHGSDILDRFSKLLNITTAGKSSLILIVSWELASLYPLGPYAVLAIDGEAGCGKTTLCRQLRRLSDPNAAPHRATPRSEDDLIIAARNGRIVGFDNVSHLSEDMADAICRLATGAGLGKRKLYTDDEEHIASVSRPVLLNGIPSLLTRSDLASRALAVTLLTIPDDARLPEAELERGFQEIAPEMLGLLLDGLKMALKRLPDIKLADLPRMADFARLACAAAPAFNWTEKDVTEAIAESAATAVTAIVEGDPVAGAVRKLVRGLPENEKAEWKGIATELLERLSGLVSETVQRGKTWPKDATRLSGRLRRLAPALRAVNIAIDLDNREGRDRDRNIILSRKPVHRSSTASGASANQKS